MPFYGKKVVLFLNGRNSRKFRNPNHNLSFTCKTQAIGPGTKLNAFRISSTTLKKIPGNPIGVWFTGLRNEETMPLKIGPEKSAKLPVILLVPANITNNIIATCKPCILFSFPLTDGTIHSLKPCYRGYEPIFLKEVGKKAGSTKDTIFLRPRAKHCCLILEKEETPNAYQLEGSKVGVRTHC